MPEEEEEKTRKMKREKRENKIKGKERTLKGDKLIQKTLK